MTIKPIKLPSPVSPGFDCERNAQNAFLYERAWSDQEERLSTTYVYHVFDDLAAYGTVCMHSIVLGTREKPRRVPYRSVAALKLAQLGVSAAYQGQGLGRTVVTDMIELARQLSTRAGCRYVALDASPDLVDWYAAQGFVINRAEQRLRVEAAEQRSQPDVTISMRFDLREKGDAASTHQLRDER
jgi:GNAT superfamily N-acetyltransferase